MQTIFNKELNHKEWTKNLMKKENLSQQKCRANTKILLKMQRKIL